MNINVNKWKSLIILMDISFYITLYTTNNRTDKLTFFFKIKTSINTSAMDMSQKFAEIDFFFFVNQ